MTAREQLLRFRFAVRLRDRACRPRVPGKDGTTRPLSGAELGVLRTLMDYADNTTGVTTVGDRTLAEASGYARSTVQKALGVLESAGMIRRQHAGRGHPSFTTLVEWYAEADDRHRPDHEATQWPDHEATSPTRSGPTVDTGGPTLDRSGPTTGPEPKELEELETPHPPTPRADAALAGVGEWEVEDILRRIEAEVGGIRAADRHRCVVEARAAGWHANAIVEAVVPEPTSNARDRAAVAMARLRGLGDPPPRPDRPCEGCGQPMNRHSQWQHDEEVEARYRAEHPEAYADLGVHEPTSTGPPPDVRDRLRALGFTTSTDEQDRA